MNQGSTAKFSFHTLAIIGLLFLSQTACRETRSLSSGEFSEFTSSQNLQVSDEEAQAILNDLIARYEADENIGGTTRAMMQILMAQLSDQRPSKAVTISPQTSQALLNKRNLYLNQVSEALDDYGFVKGCDGLLFTALLDAAAVPSEYGLAESKQEPGRWYRSATQDCFKNRRSQSTISRDMMIGLAIALWQDKDLAAVNRIISYSQVNQGILGEATDSETLLSRAFMSPSLEAIYHELRFRLGGENSDRRGYIPDFSTNLIGFQAHLQALGILMRGGLYGGILTQDFNVLQSLVNRQPKNALFQYLFESYHDGDGEKAAAILLDESLFPATRLPTSEDRCEAYLWQRDQNSDDWQACPEKNEVHPAVDFFLVSHLLLNGFSK